jgi:PAS domain-containing protein
MRHILAGQPPQVAPRQRKVSRNYTKTGRIITCEWHNSWLYDAAGHFVSALSFGQDITARQQAEETTRRLAAVVESSDDAIISKSLDGVVTSWNAGAERLFGYRAVEMLGQPILRLLPDEWHEEEQDDRGEELGFRGFS